MLSWLDNVTYNNGNIQWLMIQHIIFLFLKKLFSYKNLKFKINKIPLSDSGYRKVIKENFELFIDVGNIGPDYQPGHAHSDTFNLN